MAIYRVRYGNCRFALSELGLIHIKFKAKPTAIITLLLRVMSKAKEEVTMTTIRSQCGSEQIAPERAEYWTDRHAFHIWHCPKCTALAIKDIKSGRDDLPSQLVA